MLGLHCLTNFYSLNSKTRNLKGAKPGLSSLNCCGLWHKKQAAHRIKFAEKLKQHCEGLRSENQKHPSLFFSSGFDFVWDVFFFFSGSSFEHIGTISSSIS